MFQCLIKYGNFFQRFYIFSKVISNVNLLLKNRYYSLLIIHLLKFSTKKNRQVFWKILEFQFLSFFSRRLSLSILDFYYQSICYCKNFGLFLSIIAFPFQFKNSVKKKFNLKNIRSLRSFFCGFSINIKKKIKKFHSCFLESFFSIPFMVSSRLSQNLLWENMRIKGKKKIKKKFRILLNLLNFMVPYQTNYFIIFKILEICSEKKIYSYYSNLEKTNQKKLKNRFIMISFFLILFKSKFEKKTLFFDLSFFRCFSSIKFKKYSKEKKFVEFSNFCMEFSKKKIFYNFLKKFFKNKKKFIKKKNNRLIFINLICFLIQTIQREKILNWIVKICFSHVKLVSISMIKIKYLNKICWSKFKKLWKKDEKFGKKKENFFFLFFLNFYNVNQYKSKCKFFFCQILLKIVLRKKKKNQTSFYIKIFSDKILNNIQFREVFGKSFFSLVLNKIKIPLFFGKKNIFDLVWKTILLEI
jgi:hypothetical protein